jgi:hypothetical protein
LKRVALPSSIARLREKPLLLDRWGTPRTIIRRPSMVIEVNVSVGVCLYRAWKASATFLPCRSRTRGPISRSMKLSAPESRSSTARSVEVGFKNLNRFGGINDPFDPLSCAADRLAAGATLLQRFCHSIQTIAVEPHALVEACRITPKRPEGNLRCWIVPYEKGFAFVRIAITHEWTPGVSTAQALEVFPNSRSFVRPILLTTMPPIAEAIQPAIRSSQFSIYPATHMSRTRSSPSRSIRSDSDRPNRQTDHAATMSNSRRATPFSKASSPGRLSRPLVPLTPSSR